MELSKTKRKIMANWWWTIDSTMFIAVTILMLIGMALVLAASPPVAERIGLDRFSFAKKQLVFLFLGYGLFVFFSNLNTVTLRRFAIICFLGTFALLVLTHFVGFENKGSRRWIYLMGFSLQPSEVLKPFFAILTAWLIARSHMEKNFQGYRYSFIIFCIIAAMLIKQPDFGMTLTFAAIWGAQIFVGGIKVRTIIVLVIMGLIGFLCAYNFLPHVQKRIDTFLEGGDEGASYQTLKSLSAFKNGGITGRGIAGGEVKHTLPDAHTDFIFAVAGEEYGIILCMTIISLFCYVFFSSQVHIYQQKDFFIILAVTGLCMQLFFQMAVNMAVSVNLIPNKGMVLPFISYGGSAMLSVCIAAGMIIALTKKVYD